MNKINLYNRDGANLWLKKVKDIEPGISEWKLQVDTNHEYCLEHMRIVGDIRAIDPSGGPFLSTGDELDNSKYKIVKITNDLTIWLSERNNNN